MYFDHSRPRSLRGVENEPGAVENEPGARDADHSKVSGFYRYWYDVKGPVGPQCKLVVKATNMLS